MDWLRDGLVIVVSLVAIFTDVKWHKIPNWLTFPAIAIGFIANGLSGWNGFIQSVGGFIFALAIMLPFFSLDLLKAGDVKLVMAWGAIKGLGQPIWWTFALWAFLYGALLGGLMSLVFLAQRGKGSEEKKRLWSIWWLLLGLPQTLTHVSKSSPIKIPMPYGVALGLGALVTIAIERWFRIPCPFIAD